MSESSKRDLTEILSNYRGGDIEASATAGEIFEVVYSELHRIAAGLMSRERVDHTLQPTALVNEAYCRLVDQPRIHWKNRAHFYGIAARAMRQILIEYARAHGAQKRGGDWHRITLDERFGEEESRDLEIIALHDALDKLSENNERMGKVVEMRVFGGMSAKEVAHVLGISRQTVQEDWRIAKIWLNRELTEGTSS